MDDKTFMESLDDLELGELCFQVITGIEKDIENNPTRNTHPDYTLLRWIPAVKRKETLSPRCYTLLRKRYEMDRT